jgi:hypothetical protein
VQRPLVPVWLDFTTNGRFRLSRARQRGLSHAILELVSKQTAEFIFTDASAFRHGGLESIPAGEKEKMRLTLGKSAAKREIIAWLTGDYAIDFIAMIEQSCFVG